MRRLFRGWSDQVGAAGPTRTDQTVRLAQYNTYEARRVFSFLLRRVRRGEQIVIAHAGHPVAMLVPYDGRQSTRLGVVHAHVVVDAAAAPPRGATPTRSSPAASS